MRPRSLMFTIVLLAPCTESVTSVQSKDEPTTAVTTWAKPVTDRSLVMARLGGALPTVTHGLAADGFVAPARRVAVAGGQTTTPVTPAALDLFEAAVNWATEE